MTSFRLHIIFALLVAALQVTAQSPEVLTDVTQRATDELNLVPGYPARTPGLNRVAEIINPAITALASQENWDSAQVKLAQIYPQMSAANYAEVGRMLGSWNIKWMKNWSTWDSDSIPVTGRGGPNDPRVSFVVDWVEPHLKTFIVERAGDVNPKILAVTYPEALVTHLRSLPVAANGVPFLVYYHPTLGQATTSYNTAENLKSKQDGNWYPYGWDFLFHVFWKYLHYRGTAINMEYTLGLGHQLAASGKNVALVLPVLSKNDGVNIGDFNDPQKSQEILRAVQQFIANKEGLSLQPEIGRVALAGFSNGNGLVGTLLSRSHPYLRDQVKEVYMFDAPASLGINWINSARVWAGNDTSKVIRMYAQTAFMNANSLLGGPVGAPGVMVSNPRRQFSMALLNRAFWEPVVHTYNPNFPDYFNRNTYWAIHSLIPGGMLTDALVRSRF